MGKEKVFLTGASGSMGHEAFKLLWKKRDKYDIVILQRPSRKNKKLFKPYEKKCGIKPIKGRGVVENKGLKIVWGDATNRTDIEEACKDIDWCLSPMAYISPAADKNPEFAKAVNTEATRYIIEAIEKQPGGADHIKFVYIGTIAATGDRLPPIHVGRVGDPMKPSIFDFYACTKIAGERLVIESNIKHWAVLRQTFIMIPDIMGLQDPIMFHQPLNSCMENNTSHDAGRGLINCLDLPDDSDFWRRVYNMGGGPSCRTTYFEFLKITFDMLGLDYRNIFERRWFALRNFHMQFYEDSWILNKYINNFGESMDDYKKRMWKNMPLGLKMVSKLTKIPFIKRLVEQQTFNRMKKLASRIDGTLGWYQNRNDARISAFYGNYDAYESIPDWDGNIVNPEIGVDQERKRLDHGYDEAKDALEQDDLEGAARFRGGKCYAKKWDGDLYQELDWECAMGHEFTTNPYAVLKAGHWCPECAPPPWNYDKIAKVNPFFAQVYYPNHDPAESCFYSEDCYLDIVEDATLPSKK
jgi:nucleoside-diphosphate-sugar epimerase